MPRRRPTQGFQQGVMQYVLQNDPARLISNPGALQILGPPPGSFDPSLSAGLAATGRGLTDLLGSPVTNPDGSVTYGGDIGRGIERAGADLTTSTDDIRRQQGRAQDDLRTGHDRTLADLLLAGQREGQDYSNRVGDLSRSYERLGESQGRSIRAASAGGIAGGGALAAALAKRTANMATDRAPIDLAHQRAGEDIATRTSRENENFGLASTRLGEDVSGQLGRLGTTYSRGVEDLNTQATRAQREGTQFGLDTLASEYYAAGVPNPLLNPLPAAPRRRRRLPSFGQGVQAYAQAGGR
jgi:hypothetical protein